MLEFLIIIAKIKVKEISFEKKKRKLGLQPRKLGSYKFSRHRNSFKVKKTNNLK